MAEHDAAASERKRHVMHATIGGMHCGNCVTAVESRLRRLPGVESVAVRYPPGRAVITHSGALGLADLEGALQSDGYTASLAPAGGEAVRSERIRHYLEIGAAFLVLVAVALALQRFQLLPRGFSISDEMSYGLVVLVGLAASVSSCLAVTGGLLVAFAAKYNEANAGLTDWQRLAPHICFNLGRIVAYTALGGAIGALGAALTLTPAASGVLTVLASLLMIMLGLNLLGLLPSVGRYLPSLPPALARRFDDATASQTKGAAFLLGGATFFLPCGFTQALQLYVLGKASLTVGALTMLAFALGTLPALLSLSTISSLAKGAFQERMLRVAGAAVILLGILNIQYGLALTGIDAARTASVAPTAVAAALEPGGQSQRMTMKIVDLDYRPHQFVVRQGIPVQWRIDASEAVGCGRILLAPQLGIRKILSADSTTLVTFTPGTPGDFAFNCGMGMMTADAKITVLPPP